MYHEVFSIEMPYKGILEKSTKDEILNDFVGVLNQIDSKPSDEIESNLQKIVHKMRPLIHKI